MRQGELFDGTAYGEYEKPSEPFEISLAKGVPRSEFSEEFVQGMANRMSVSFHKYGRVMDGIGKVDEIAGLEKRLALYKETGNTEWLMDVANFAMIEFMHRGPSAFHATSSEESPGLPTPWGGTLHGRHTQEGQQAAHFYKGKQE